MISAIVFDYGGVIELLPKRDLVQEIMEYLNITKEDWERVFFSMNHRYNVHNENFEDVIAMMSKELGANAQQQAHIKNLAKKSDFSGAMTINEELIEIIKNLKSKNYKIGLLSNWNNSLRQRLIEKKLLHLFDAVIISGEVGFQKPQPEIFEILFDKLGVPGHELVFVDDNSNSLKGAENIGYTPILYLDNKQFKEELNAICGIDF